MRVLLWCMFVHEQLYFMWSARSQAFGTMSPRRSHACYPYTIPTRSCRNIFIDKLARESRMLEGAQLALNGIYLLGKFD